MSQLSEQLHEDARRRFEELGRNLLERVTTFRDPPSQNRPAYSPNVFTAATLTDADRVGDLRLEWQDSHGNLTGIAFAEVGGLRKGIVGPDYEKLEELVSSMARVRPFRGTASVKFLREQIFEWVKERHRGQSSVGCVDFVLQRLENAAAEHGLLFPVSDLDVQSPLTLGSVTVSTFPESIFEELEAEPKDGPPIEVRRKLSLSMRQEFQGRAVAETSVFAEPIRAQEIAGERVDLAIGVLRFFTPPGYTSRIARWGYAPCRTDRVFVTDRTGRFLRTSTAVVDPDGTTVLSDQLRDIWLSIGLSEVRDILARASRTDFEEALLMGMVTFGRAALTPDLREKMIWYCAGLESILIRDSSEPILHNLSERLAMFAYDKVQHREVALKDVKEAYSLRSRFVHHGTEIDEVEAVSRFADHGQQVFRRIAKTAHRFSSKVEFIKHIDRMKLSGFSQ